MIKSTETHNEANNISVTIIEPTNVKNVDNENTSTTLSLTAADIKDQEKNTEDLKDPSNAEEDQTASKVSTDKKVESQNDNNIDTGTEKDNKPKKDSEEKEPILHTGFISKWIPNKGYGFIDVNGGAEYGDLYFHVSSIASRKERTEFKTKVPVSFVISKDDNDRYVAHNLQKIHTSNEETLKNEKDLAVKQKKQDQKPKKEDMVLVNKQTLQKLVRTFDLYTKSKGLNDKTPNFTSKRSQSQNQSSRWQSKKHYQTVSIAKKYSNPKYIHTSPKNMKQPQKFAQDIKQPQKRPKNTKHNQRKHLGRSKMQNRPNHSRPNYRSHQRQQQQQQIRFVRARRHSAPVLRRSNNSNGRMNNHPVYDNSTQTALQATAALLNMNQYSDNGSASFSYFPSSSMGRSSYADNRMQQQDAFNMMYSNYAHTQQRIQSNFIPDAPKLAIPVSPQLSPAYFAPYVAVNQYYSSPMTPTYSSPPMTPVYSPPNNPSMPPVLLPEEFIPFNLDNSPSPTIDYSKLSLSMDEMPGSINSGSPFGLGHNLFSNNFEIMKAAEALLDIGNTTPTNQSNNNDSVFAMNENSDTKMTAITAVQS